MLVDLALSKSQQSCTVGPRRTEPPGEARGVVGEDCPLERGQIIGAFVFAECCPQHTGLLPVGHLVGEQVDHAGEFPWTQDLAGEGFQEPAHRCERGQRFLDRGVRA